MTDKPANATEALRELVADYQRWIDEGVIVAAPGTRSGKALANARAVLAEPPKDPDAEIAMLRRVYITDPMPGWIPDPEKAAATIRMLLERRPVPSLSAGGKDYAALLRVHGRSDELNAMVEDKKAPFSQREAIEAIQELCMGAATEIERLRALARLAAPVPEWIPVGERLPDAIPVLAYGQNSHGKGRRMRAEFIRKGTREDNGDYEPIGDYDKAKDTYFWPEGWYEWNECEETHWKIDIPITHWMPLPPPPAADK